MSKIMSLLTGLICAVLIVFLVTASIPVQANSGEVKEHVRTMINSVIDVFNDPGLKGPDKREQRERVLRDKAETIFDWEEMARRTLGRYWRDITPEQRNQFTEIFVDFLQRVYLDRIDSFMDQIKGLSYDSVEYIGETIQGRYCRVETKISIDKNQFPVNYSLINKDDKWVVYDVNIEGIGLVSNYRNQFNDILNRSSFDDLIQQLKSRKPEEEKLEGLPDLEKSS